MPLLLIVLFSRQYINYSVHMLCNWSVSHCVLAAVVDVIDKANATSHNYSVVSTEQVGKTASSRCWCVAALSSPVTGVTTPSQCDLLKSVQF